jgi:hypothetical protein
MARCRSGELSSCCTFVQYPNTKYAGTPSHRNLTTLGATGLDIVRLSEKYGYRINEICFSQLWPTGRARFLRAQNNRQNLSGIFNGLNTHESIT